MGPEADDPMNINDPMNTIEAGFFYPPGFFNTLF